MEHGEFFISLVQEHELLWNKVNAHFKAADKKAVAWEQIGASFNLTGQQASQTFVSLRQKYLREKEKETAAITSGKPLKAPWLLMNSMRFLDAVISPRKGQSSLLMSNQSARSKNKTVPFSSANEHEDDDSEVLSAFTVSEHPFSDSSSPQSETSLSFSFDALTRNTKIKAIPISALTETQAPPSTTLDSPISSPTNTSNQQNNILTTSTQTKRLKRKHEEPDIASLIAAIEAPVHIQAVDSEDWNVKDEVKTFCKYFATRLNRLPDNVRNDFENETLFHLHDVEQSSRK